MNKNRPRSSLRRAPNEDDDVTNTALRMKKRISFSGKKSVREFIDTEEQKNWDYSCEVSGEEIPSFGRSKEDAPPPPPPQNESHLSVHIDASLKLQTSVDVTLLPCERDRPARRVLTPLLYGQDAESIYLSNEEQARLQRQSFNVRCMDKTMDVMSGSLVSRLGPKEKVKSQSIGDSFMDITPLGLAAESVAPRASAAPAAWQSVMDLEPEEWEKENQPVCRENEKEKPPQAHDDLDIFQDCPLMVPEESPRLVFNNTASSTNSTLAYLKDESVLIPLDMIAGENVSRKINFRQLNEELEAGKIQIFPNGPKTPTTDRKQQRRFWEGMEEDPMPVRDIRSLKPRATLNFSENMMMSPAVETPPPVVRDKREKNKQRYRFSQADELMLNNTNFLAHAKLGDETQSRNTSKNSTRRETTFEHNDLALSAVKVPEREPAYASRRTLHLNESIDEEGMHVRKEIDEEIVVQKAEDAEEQVVYRATFEKCTKSKRRETLLLQESMEVDATSPLKDAAPQEKVKSKARQTVCVAEALEEELPQGKAKARQTILAAEPMDEETQQGVQSFHTKTKPRHTVLMQEPIEEEGIFPKMSTTQPSKSKARQTLLLAEPIEEELVRDAPVAGFKAKPRQTMHLEEPMEEELGSQSTATAGQTLRLEDPPESKINSRYSLRPRSRSPKAGVPDVPGHNVPSQPNKSKSRQTLLLEEPMEEELGNQASLRPTTSSSQAKTRQTLFLQESMEEERDSDKSKTVPACEQKPLHVSVKSKSRQTMLLHESLEEEKENATNCQPKTTSSRVSNNLKYRQTLLVQEDIVEEPLREEKPVKVFLKNKARQTLLLQESMEEEKDNRTVGYSENAAQSKNIPSKVPISQHHKIKSRQTLLVEEPMDEEAKTNSKPIPQANYYNKKPRQTLLLQESMEEEQDIATHSLSRQFKNTLEISGQKVPQVSTVAIEEEPKKGSPVLYPKTKARQTMLLQESIQEDLDNAASYSPPKASVSHARNVSTKASFSHHNNQSNRRQTMHLEESMEEETNEIKREEKKAIPKCKSRQTLVFNESINVEAADPLNNPPKLSQEPSLNVEEMSGLEAINWQQKHKNVDTGFAKSRQTILAAEAMDLENLEETMPHARPLGEKKQNETTRPTYRKSVYMESVSMACTPQRTINPNSSNLSVDDFEKMEEFCKKTPKGQPKPQSIARRVLEGNAARLGTPRCQPGMKRLPIHLTPNLPDSKKRNHQLFNDSNMEIDEVADKSRIPIRSTFNFEDSLQPVRDCRQIVEQFQVEPLPEVEEKPITVSDVSQFFQVQKLPAEERDRDSGGSDRTFKSLAPTNQKLMRLWGDSTMFGTPQPVEIIDSDAEEADDQIDNEKMSLVSTMGEESKEEPQPELEMCEQQQIPAVPSGSKGSCRRCRTCPRSMNETELGSVSFALPQRDPWDFSKERNMLIRLRSKPTLQEVHQNWLLREKEHQMAALEADVEVTVTEDVQHNSFQQLLALTQRPLSTPAKGIQGSTRELVASPESFFERLKRSLDSQQPNWIFDCQMKCSRQMIFYNRLLPTFRLVVRYENLDDLETAVRVSSVAVDNEVAVPKERWTVYYHYQDFQLSLKLPVNLTNAIAGSSVDACLEFLQGINHSCETVKQTMNLLLTTLMQTGARMLREANRTVVRKSVWRETPGEAFSRYEKINFRIEISNVEKVCFRDILEPSIHLFDENIQHLPMGIAFLETFLPRPDTFLANL